MINPLILSAYEFHLYFAGYLVFVMGKLVIILSCQVFLETKEDTNVYESKIDNYFVYLIL